MLDDESGCAEQRASSVSQVTVETSHFFFSFSCVTVFKPMGCVVPASKFD